MLDGPPPFAGFSAYISGASSVWGGAEEPAAPKGESEGFGTRLRGVRRSSSSKSSSASKSSIGTPLGVSQGQGRQPASPNQCGSESAYRDPSSLSPHQRDEPQGVRAPCLPAYD